MGVLKSLGRGRGVGYEVFGREVGREVWRGYDFIWDDGHDTAEVNAYICICGRRYGNGLVWLWRYDDSGINRRSVARR